MTISAQDRSIISQQFQALAAPVKLDYFHQSPKRVLVPGRVERPSCAFALDVYSEIAALSPQLSLDVHEFEDHPETAAKRGASDVPCIVVRGELNRPIRLYGPPNGHLLVALVRAIVLASARPKALAAITRSLKRLRSPAAIQVFASPLQQESGEAALAAWATALLSPKLAADVYVVEEFPDHARRASVQAIPSTIFPNMPPAPGVIDGQALAEFAALSQTRPERASLNPPNSRPNSAVAWRPPQPQQRAPQQRTPDPTALAAGAAATETPAGMHRAPSGLIIPDR